jgi:hypothetical protein
MSKSCGEKEEKKCCEARSRGEESAGQTRHREHSLGSRAILSKSRYFVERSETGRTARRNVNASSNAIEAVLGRQRLQRFPSCRKAKPQLLSGFGSAEFFDLLAQNELSNTREASLEGLARRPELLQHFSDWCRALSRAVVGIFIEKMSMHASLRLCRNPRNALNPLYWAFWDLTHLVSAGWR